MARPGGAAASAGHCPAGGTESARRTARTRRRPGPPPGGRRAVGALSWQPRPQCVRLGLGVRVRHRAVAGEPSRPGHGDWESQPRGPSPPPGRDGPGPGRAESAREPPPRPRRHSGWHAGCRRAAGRWPGRRRRPGRGRRLSLPVRRLCDSVTVAAGDPAGPAAGAGHSPLPGRMPGQPGGPQAGRRSLDSDGHSG